jgi:hypothetical protein
MERKAATDPKKAKKMVKKKAPDGFVGWGKDTLAKLSEGRPEPLVSRFQVSHAMVLEVLGREGTLNCDALRDLIRRSHESPVQKRRHGRQAFRLFRSLRDRGIVELNPLRVNVDLQQDFSLNQSLSLYLIDTLKLLDPADPNYALDVLTLVESILENPELILRRQVDRAKTQKMGEMKAAGIEYDERIAELEKVEYPKPRREFIYDTFNRFSADHPWVGEENIRPKSIAREMFETFQSFPDYIRDYDLQRVEGLLLRYLSEVYKVLVQTVPETDRTDEVLSMIEYFGEMLREIDSSLLEEWEKLRDPKAAAEKRAVRDAQDAAAEVERRRLEALEREKHARAATVRNEVFRALRALANRDFVEASERLATPAVELEAKMAEYVAEHGGVGRYGPLLRLDQDARSVRNSKIIEVTPKSWQVTQMLLDTDGTSSWALEVEATRTSSERIQLRLVKFGAI